ncbi:hypothetical protein ACFOY8_16555 [Thalassospira xianhensis]|uniref:Uncharacterized protein n=1 Tax=Thalassospira xianhensis MCCC 1A02616 TaxID=1177929 RepID=A0A367U8L1_9PROT|nr:hypothetical protein [Thalassospira xianhensis]RCK03644.1 hypothetical protein TH5_24260 [Thalassospira xianhensis MCCC 1A02616]
MSEGLEITLKIVSILAGILGIILTIMSITRHNSKGKQEFFQKIFVDSNVNELHDYAIERSFFELHGINSKASTIKFLLSKENPFKKLSQYKTSKMFMKETNTRNGKIKSMKIKNFYDENYITLTIFGTILYFIFFSSSFYPYSWFNNLNQFGKNPEIYLLIFLSFTWFTVLMTLALITANLVQSLITAKELSKSINNQ